MPLEVAKEYDISDLDQEGLTAPMLYYQKPGGGPGRNAQYLGQTRNGDTITNVRFPMNASWDFLENLNWAVVGQEEPFHWWREQKGNSIPNKLSFNDTFLQDPENAKIFDFCVGMGTVQQVRKWNGKEYYMSKAMAKNGKPCLTREQPDNNYSVATSFPWHKYVNVLTPPTYNTWGYGIGFYYYKGGWSYKSFPILPLKTFMVPDFYPTPEGATTWTKSFASCAKTYTGEPGETIDIPVRLYNGGVSESKTDFQASWYGSGWQNPVWNAGDVQLAPGEYQEFTVPVTVPQPGQETRLVFQANLNQNNPPHEQSFENNVMVIKVQPNGVDVAVIMPPVKNYTVDYGQKASVDIEGVVMRYDRVPEAVKVEATINSPKGIETKTFNLSAGPMREVPINIRFNAGPGTYKVHLKAYPTDVHDINLSNNYAYTTVKVFEKKPPQKGDSDDETRVNLRG